LVVGSGSHLGKQSQFRVTVRPKARSGLAKQSQFEGIVRQKVGSSHAKQSQLAARRRRAKWRPEKGLREDKWRLCTSHFKRNALRRHYEQGASCKTKPIRLAGLPACLRSPLWRRKILRLYALGRACETKPIGRLRLDGSRSLCYADDCRQTTSVELWDFRAWCGCPIRSRALRRSGRCDSARCCLRVIQPIPAFPCCSLVPGCVFGPVCRDPRSACPFPGPGHRSLPARRPVTEQVTWGKLASSLIPGPCRSDIGKGNFLPEYVSNCKRVVE